MEKQEKKYKRIEELDESGVVSLLVRNDLQEFVEFAKERQLDGRSLLDVSEGIVKLWRPKLNTKRFITFLDEIKNYPEKYLDDQDNTAIMENDNHLQTVETIDTENNKTDKIDIENQYQTVIHRKKEINAQASNSMSTVEELIRRIVPTKSFLYPNQQKKDKTPSYLPMDAGTPKKKKLFRFNSYEYPFLDIRARFSRQESSNDRGYYTMKTNSRYYIARTYKKPESRPKYKTLSTPEEISTKYSEDHFYEDLCYNDIEKEERPVETKVANVKPCIVKIQELFNSFRVPFFRKHEMLEEFKEKVDNDPNYYENSDSVVNMYDSVNANIIPVDNKAKDISHLPVEDYLEPIQLSKDYCDVNYKEKEESLLGYVLSIFESRFGLRRDTNETHKSELSEDPQKTESISEDEPRKWSEDRKPGHTNMADRPLPVPVENESYYMNIDRMEAHNLLKGQPDGMFILRPSSQPNHAYTISVSCANAVHNVGVRRRPDGRLALGFSRRGEQSFASITSLLRHHKKRRLMLVAGREFIGATTLNDSPTYSYYQTPRSIPLPVEM